MKSPSEVCTNADVQSILCLTTAQIAVLLIMPAAAEHAL